MCSGMVQAEPHHGGVCGQRAAHVSEHFCAQTEPVLPEMHPTVLPHGGNPSRAERHKRFASELQQFPSFGWVVPPLGKATHPETSDLPRPTLLRRGNETFPPERGEKPEGTRNREVGNELHGSVSQARLKTVACCRRCPGGPPALCQQVTGAAAAGSGQPQSSGRGGTRRRAETSPGGGEGPRGDTGGDARPRGRARRPRSGADPRPSRGSLCR